MHKAQRRTYVARTATQFPRYRTDTPWAVLSVHRRKLGRIDSLQRWSLRQTTNPVPVRPSRTRLTVLLDTSRSLIIPFHFTSASSSAILQFTRTVYRLHICGSAKLDAVSGGETLA